MNDGRPDHAGNARAHANAQMSAERAAVAAIENWGRGRPVAEVEAALVDELRTRRVFMAQEDIHLQARWISDPHWAQKDPQARDRLLAAMESPSRSKVERDFEREWDRTEQRLERALDRMWRLRRSAVSSQRTFDGVEFEIRIEPWSTRRVKRLQRAAAPAVVSVLPYD
jgi:hypothetical protein